MIRVLHLSSSTPDFHTTRLMAALRQHSESPFKITTRTIGRGGDYRSGQFAHVGIRSKHGEVFDVIHAFTLEALDAAVTTGKVVFSPSAPLSPKAIAEFGPKMGKALLDVVCASEAERDMYDTNRIPHRCTMVIPPPIDFTKVTGTRNRELRTALGFRPDDQVFLLPGESDRRTNHHDALWTISILHVLYPQCRALLWGRGDMIDTLDRLSQKLRQPGMLTIAERKLGRRIEFEELLSVSDAALFTPDGPTSTLPLALCMAAGLPIIAGESPWLDELLQDGRNAALVSPATPRMLAQRIVELRADPALSAKIATAAEKEAKKKFQAKHVVKDYCLIYLNIVANIPLKV